MSAIRLPEDVRRYAQLDLIRSIPFERLPPIYLYRYRAFKADPSFVTHTTVLENEQAVFDLTMGPDFDMSRTVAGVGIPTIQSEARGTVTVQHMDRSSIEFKVASDGPGWVVFKQKYDPVWKVSVDGTPGELHAVNVLHCGIPVKAGNHVVNMVYTPSKLVFYVTLISWMLAVSCLIFLLFRRSTTWSLEYQARRSTIA